MPDEQSAQALDHLKERFPFLFHQDPAQKYAKGTDIAAKREFLDGVGSIGGQFRESSPRIVLAPQRRIGHGVF